MRQDRSGEIKISGKSSSFEMDMLPQISVLLPTYKRTDALSRTLSALQDQSIPIDQYEIIIVDDGSNDETAQILQQCTSAGPGRINYVVLKENGGPARARNFGLAMCRAEVVLIIGDDIEPDKCLVEKHLESHRQHPEESHGLLGTVTFPDELQPNGFMKWLEKGGRKYFFNYQALHAGQETGPLFFYTCNVSVKMSLLEKSGWFDESFPFASHEDLELGYRLADSGMQLIFEPTARGYHWHMLSVEGIARRVYLMGYSAVLFWQKVGDSGGFIRQLLRNTLAGFSATSPAVSIWQRLRRKNYSGEKEYPFQWHILLFLSFFIGLADSRKKRPVRL